jgi:hypothetical protein
MNLIPKTGISWEARQVRIKQGKTGNYKVIGPLGPTSMAILREFSTRRKRIWCFHAAATSRRSFIGFSEKPAGVPAYRTEGRILTAWFSTTPGIQRLRTSGKQREPKDSAGMHGLVRQGICSLLLTRDETIQRRGRPIAGKACWRKNRVRHQLAKSTLPQTR